MDKAYAGLRVLDISTTIAGPYCARLFADLGADVIKIEPPEGEVMRSRLPLRNGASTIFGQLNAGKRCVALDMKEERARAAVRRLAARTDVLVENFRPGVMRRLGLDYPALYETNPRLVYCAISGYGQTGPSATLPAYAPVIHAASGFDRAHLAYQPDRTRPDNCGIFIADVLSGAFAFGAVATALNQRQQTGQGQMIDVSMLEAMLSLTLTEVQTAQFPVPPTRRPIFGPIATADGYITLAIASERTFAALAATAGRPDWPADPRFAEYRARRAHWGELMDELELWTQQRSTAECLAALDRNGVPASAYRTVAEAMRDPQIAHRGALAEVHDAGGAFQVVNPPFRMTGSAVGVGARAASLGEDTRSVLAEAGYSAGEIDVLVG